MSKTLSEMAFRAMSLDFSGDLARRLAESKQFTGVDQAALRRLMTGSYRDGFVTALVLMDANVDLNAVPRSRVNREALIKGLKFYEAFVAEHTAGN